MYQPFLRYVGAGQRRMRQQPSQIRMEEIRKNSRPLGQKHEIIRPIPNAITQGALQHRPPLITSHRLSFCFHTIFPPVIW